jgi:hypothetical protein
MSRSALRTLVAVFVLVSVGCFLLAVCFYRGDGHTQLDGEVVGPDDKPVAGAEVQLSEAGPHRATAVTDEAGRYTVGLSHAPYDVPLVVTITRAGYKPYRQEFQSGRQERFPKSIKLEVDSAARAADDENPFPLRTDAPTTDWKGDAINEGLPYRWEKGTVHVLAWEAVEEKRSDDKRFLTTQILVLKRFDRPTEDGQHRWVLAQLYYHPENKERRWSRSMLHIPPLGPGEKMPKLTDAQVFGHEFYNKLPTDQQIAVFLRQSGWTRVLGLGWAITDAGTITYVTTLAAGGVDRALWQRLFERDVPTELFPQLKKAPASEG